MGGSGEGQEGVLPRLLKELLASKRDGILVEATYFEIYDKKFRDLLVCHTPCIVDYMTYVSAIHFGPPF